MTIIEAIKNRHSVRSYIDRPLEQEHIEKLEQAIAECNEQSGLHIQLVTNEPEAFDGFLAHYGKFNNVKNYIALIGKKGPQLDELCGYYGEKIVLRAQQMGLNTCWVYLTYRKVKNAFVVHEDEKLCCVIAIGYGENQGVQHCSKSIDDVVITDDDKSQSWNMSDISLRQYGSIYDITSSMPKWFINGVEMALLAPTSQNQQKFEFMYEDGQVHAVAGFGICTKIDLGIVKYHFEVGAGKENFEWKKAY